MHGGGKEEASERGRYGLLAEFETAESLLEAARRVRDAGHTRWDSFTPYPVHGLDRAMGMRDTRIAWIVLVAAITGAVVAQLLQWWTNAVDYRLIIAGKPFWSIPATIPVTFELTVLFGALAAFVGMFAFNRLPQLYHPTFRSERFRRVTDDRFFLAIEADDPKFDAERTERLLQSSGAVNVEWLED